mmetsp:Transcript_97860/g.187748  ORF Transcript_97860/g.187748 Transcript_97860/m.187748 type:complete len:465 (+) Transcript_97860:82-1476(+)
MAAQFLQAAAPRKRLKPLDWASKKAAPEMPAPQKRRRLDWAAKCEAAKQHAALVLPGDLMNRSGPSTAQELPRVAIAVCSRGCPAARLREWLFWHLSLGVHRIFLRWEGPMDSAQSEALRGPQSRGEVILKRHDGNSLSSAFEKVMCRQVHFTQNSMQEAKDQGCSFLLHIDDDELLCPIASGISIPEIFQPFSGSSKRCIHFQNLEAVFPFEVTTNRPFSRPLTRFRRASNAVLYCNGKSAAHLEAMPVYASGVHRFCMYDRTFKESDPSFGLHDNPDGCSHPDCCVVSAAAVVLHFDSPSFLEWKQKFNARAKSKLNGNDKAEMDIFPFKKESVDILRKRPAASQVAEEQVYKTWRCLPGRANDKFHTRVTGQSVESRFQACLAAARPPAQETPPCPTSLELAGEPASGARMGGSSHAQGVSSLQGRFRAALNEALASRSLHLAVSSQHLSPPTELNRQGDV